MPNKHAHLDDLKDKLQDAKRAAHMPNASARDKADARLLEQETAAARLKAKHTKTEKKESGDDVDAKLDKALKDSFPGSDPVSFVQAAPAKKTDTNRK